MKKTNKKQRGITLIALIITIIVMLILVEVGIILALRNGLFNTTENTTSNLTEDAPKNTIKEQDKEKDKERAEEKSKIPIGLKVGDYISNYDPTPVYNNGTNYKVAGSLSGTGEEQTFTEDTTLGWRVLSIDKATGKVELIADKATSTEIQLEGAIGWNNSINILNDTCKAIYSKAGVGEARSINVEDVNTISGYDPTTFEEYGSTYSASEFESDNKFPLEYLKEKGITTFTEEEIAQGYAENSTINIENTYYYYEPEKQTGYIAPAGLIDLESDYWLASRCVGFFDYLADFDVHFMEFDTGATAFGLFHCSGGERSPMRAFRPVVTLTSNVQLEKDETATTADKTYWKIK